MDGVGVSDNELGNAVKMAYKPNLDELWNNCPHTVLRAHGLAVGLPSDSDMGNSEVGHNAIGCGQIYSQGRNWLTKISNPVQCLIQLPGKIWLKT